MRTASEASAPSLPSSAAGTQWLAYYEGARADQVLGPEERAPGSAAWMMRNMLREGELGVPAGVHTYLRHNDTAGTVEGALPHIAAFMLARQEHWRAAAPTEPPAPSAVPHSLAAPGQVLLRLHGLVRRLVPVGRPVRHALRPAARRRIRTRAAGERPLLSFPCCIVPYTSHSQQAFARDYELCSVRVNCTGVDPRNQSAECAAAITPA